ncbi:hypothetical protein HNV12_00090 [Methanococcoides sp. SA1]|nr:hypothetical protein [Methanococcoides sp. SA1]
MRKNESQVRQNLVWKLSSFEAKKDVGKLPVKVEARLRGSVANYRSGYRYYIQSKSSGFYGMLL